MAEQHDDERSDRSRGGDDRRQSSSGRGERGRRDGDRRGGSSQGDRRPSYGDRKPYGERSNDRGERRSYGDRDNRSDRGERRPYGDRDNRDRKPYGDRNSNDRGERRPYGDRDNRDRKPYGDRNSNDRGERRPYGDRDNRDRKPYGDRNNDRGAGRSYGDHDNRDRKPYGDRNSSDRGERRPYGDRDNRGDRDRKPYGERNHAQRGGRDREDDGMPDLRPVRERFRAPDLPADVTPDELDGIARMQLKTLQKENADVAAMHLAMTARLIDDDPELAHQHALAASRTAGRIGVVRETLGITAYTTGDFALALRELRTYRRITGNDDQIPLMVDCERGLSRPEKALELARSVDASKLDTEVRVELAIAKSGARLDLGQAQEALEELRIPELDRTRAFDYSPALFAAHATVLEELGRTEESAEWFALSDKAVDALENAYLEKGTEEVSIEEERLPEPEPELEPEQEQESDEAVADEVVVDEAVADEAPVEVEEAAADESPVEAAPVEEAPVAEAPVSEAPVSEDEAAPVAEVPETPADAADADDAEDDIALFDFKED